MAGLHAIPSCNAGVGIDISCETPFRDLAPRPVPVLWRLSGPWARPFFEEALPGSTVAPCSARAAVFSVVLASLFATVASGNSFRSRSGA